MVTSVVEQFWLFDVTFSIEAFKGAGADTGATLELLTRTARSEIMTTGHPLRANAPRVPAVTNRAGHRVAKGGRGSGGWTGRNPAELWYCGQQKNQCKCGSCDGRCGPTNGCPCEDCFALLTTHKPWLAWVRQLAAGKVGVVVDRNAPPGTPPRPLQHIVPEVTVNITWLVQQLSDQMQLVFAIDRRSDGCRTPRRNEEIDRALIELERLRSWSNAVANYFSRAQLFNVVSASDWRALDGAVATAVQQLFVPVLAVFEDRAHHTIERNPVTTAVGPGTGALVKAGPLPSTTEATSHALSVGDSNTFLAEQRRRLAVSADELQKFFGASAGLVSTTEAKLLVALHHLDSCVQQFSDAVNYVEGMLYAQLEAAIGKVVTAEDFRLFMQHHERTLFVPAVRPKPFSFAIRRPNHYPDGNLSIEAAASTAAGLAEPIFTTVRALPGPNVPMSFAINAATSVLFTGDRYLHAYVAQTFAGSTPPSLQLSARAMQFSSFLMLIGRMGSATTFQPQHGIILQNQDDLTIPLMPETLPSAKEFKDAIQSLSPEQQRFAKAYREMQLEGSVFGVLIVQLKPQLEVLLRLPPGSLTKEIQLCQDLLELFITYQIPSDLLTYDGDVESQPAEKLKEVKAHVAAIHQTVSQMKEQEVARFRMATSGNIRFVAVARRDDQKPMLASFTYQIGELSPQKVRSRPVISCPSQRNRAYRACKAVGVRNCGLCSMRPLHKKSSNLIGLLSTLD